MAPATSSERPKGFAKWNPRPQTLAIVNQVQEILEMYHAHLPMTVRQIFYRLVGAYGYEKTEKGYNRLAEHLVRARRAQLIPFDAIRDDGTIDHRPWGFADEVAFWEDVRDSAEQYKKDRMLPQPVSVELWCEAAGMVPQLARAMSKYSVPVYSTGGFSSVTVTHEIAERARDLDKRTIFLHVGDFDPSGQSIFDSMSKDALYFVAGYRGGSLAEAEEKFCAKRVALTLEQVEEHDLPTAPPKASDSRSANWYEETCQLEAMPPDLLAETVIEAVESEIDLSILERTIEEQRDERHSITEKLDEVEEAI